MDISYPIMLKLPESTNFVFHALMFLCRTPRASTGVKAISNALGASPSYLAKLFQKLARAGLVTSLRGRGGGYALSQPAEEITLWDVMRALQGVTVNKGVWPSQCPVCLQGERCPCQESLRRANEEIIRVFRQVTVAAAALLEAASPKVEK